MNEINFFSIVFFVFGAVVGSFLNVCIVRLPKEESVVKPRSHCRQCHKMIPWYDNIPLVSFILLRGRCRFCRASFSYRYVFVEFVTGMIFFLFYRFFGLDLLLLPYLFMMSCFIIATMVDFEHRIIPDEVSIGGMYVGIFLSLCIPSLHQAMIHHLSMGRYIMWIVVVICCIGSYIEETFINKDSSEGASVDWVLLSFTLICIVVDLLIKFSVPTHQSGSLSFATPYLLSLDSSIIGLLIGGGAVYIMGIIGDVLFRKESIGGGDIKLVAMIGAILGWKCALLTFFIAPFFGAVFGIIEKIRTKKTTIPYGPFLVLGAIISLFWSEPIIAWILRGYSFH